MVQVKVGDRVRLVGTGWAEDYDGYGAGDIVEVVEIDEYGDIWANGVGTVGKNGTLYTDDPDGPYKGVFAVELVTDKAKQGESSFEQTVRRILTDVGDIVVARNKEYGNSALDPVRVFSKSDRMGQLKVQLDHKLSRIARGGDPGLDTLRDLIGYEVLYIIAMETE